mgnify:CR=1 FL=1
MKRILKKLQNRIENNLQKIELYYDSVPIFLTQIKIINNVDFEKLKLKRWFYDNRYTITIIEEILEKIENDKKRIA